MQKSSMGNTPTLLKRMMHYIDKISVNGFVGVHLKPHATRLKSAKYKTHVIKEHFLKWMRYNKIN